MKKIVIAVLILLAAALAVFYYMKPAPALPKAVYINTDNQPTLGNKDATVKIVAFEDLKCGNCMRFTTQVFPKIKKAFIDTGIANYTVINIAFIPGSMPAANAARCLYQQKNQLFFDFIEYIYQHQPPESENWATIPFLMNAAKQLNGVNPSQFEQCLAKSPNEQVILNNLQQASALMNGVVATPTVYVNGRIVKPLSFDRIQTLVKAAQKD